MVPSERSFRERDEARKNGLLLDRKVVEALQAIAGRSKSVSL